jgi:5'-nucleotidase
VRVAYDPSAPAGRHITSVYIGKEPLDPARTYTVSTFSFLGTGGDNFGAFTEGTARDTGLVDRDLWIDYLGDHPGLAPDFARQQVGVTGTPIAGERSQIALSKLDLTSAGSPANTSVTVTGADADGYELDLGSFPVAGGAAKRLLNVPAELAGGTLTLTAAPTGTTATVPVLAAPRIRAQAPAVSPGTRGRATVTVTAAGGHTPTGAVTVSSGGTVLGTGTLAGGTATIPLATTGLAPGAYPVTATYSGDTVVLGGTDAFTLRVTKAAARLTVAAPGKKVVRNRTRADLRVHVTGFQGRAATGRVVVRAAGRTIVRSLSNGGVAVRLPKFRSAGRKTVVVTYTGDGRTIGATRSLTLKVKRS